MTANSFDILNRMTDPFIALDRNWNFTHLNQAASRLLFEQRKDLLGQCIWAQFPETVESVLFVNCHKSMSDQSVVEFDEYYLSLQTWFEVRIYPSQTGICVLFLDITERKKEAAERDQHYRSLFLHHPDGIAAMDTQGQLLNVNPAAELLSGFTANELLQNSSFKELIYEEDLEKVISYFERAKQGEAVSCEGRFFQKSGRIANIQTTFVPIVFDGEIVSIFAIAKDISQRKQMEVALRRSEKSLVESQRIARVGSWEYDLQENGYYSSVEAFRILGMEPRPGPLKLEDWIDLVHPEDRKLVIDAAEKIKQGIPLTMEYRVILSNGEERVVHTQREVIYENGKMQRIFGIIQDITERKKMEKLLINSERKDNILQLTFTLAKVLDSRDYYTANHSENVAHYAKKIAEEMHLSRMACENIYIGGLLHDIGKIGVPDALLTKPSRLTNEEYEIIKQHPVIGFNMLKHIAFFKKNGILKMVMHHHERYDGKGYPNGIAGDKIPLSARIMAVADTFDAMTSKRVYRGELDLEYTIDEIRKNAGTQFDPEVVKAFLSLWDREGQRILPAHHASTTIHDPEILGLSTKMVHIRMP